MHASLFIDIEGEALLPEDIALLQHSSVAGVILFGRNTVNAEQVAALVASIKQVRSNLLVALDQEGGRVQRLKEGVSRIPAMGKILTVCGNDLNLASDHAKHFGCLLSYELAQLGVDFSFAPVLDLDYGHNQVIGDRAFSGEVAVVNHLADAFRDGMRLSGMIGVGKHFPGHGWAKADTHEACALDERPLADVMTKDVLPFAHSIEQGIEAIMPAHVIYTQCDPSPAGFSPYWLQEILRTQLGFGGVIFSDDLTMQAAAEMGSYAKRAELAVEAGCDVLLPCNNREGVLEILGYLEANNIEPSVALGGLNRRTIDFNSPELVAKCHQAKTLLSQY